MCKIKFLRKLFLLVLMEYGIFFSQIDAFCVQTISDWRFCSAHSDTMFWHDWTTDDYTLSCDRLLECQALQKKE